MYLSRVEIDTSNRAKVKDLTHLGAYHNWVEKCFVVNQNRDTSRKLWRIDKLRDKKYLLIVSKDKPNIKILEMYGVPNTAQTKEYGTFIDGLEEGGYAHFKITLNPVVSIKSDVNPNAKRGRVVPHVTVDQQMNFLMDRAEKHGFKLESNSFHIVERKYERLKKGNNKQINVSVVTYQGKLLITNIEKFRLALTNGIGKKKAYGCGMLTVIPTQNNES